MKDNRYMNETNMRRVEVSDIMNRKSVIKICECSDCLPCVECNNDTVPALIDHPDLDRKICSFCYDEMRYELYFG